MSIALFDSLLKDTKIVASARFNKGKRLAQKTWWSLFSISFLSISLVLLTVSENALNIKLINPLFLSEILMPSWVFTLIASLLILALSIAVSSARLEVQFEKLNESAIRINRISREIEAAKNQIPLPSYADSLKKYQDTIAENPINHDNIDFRIAKCEINKVKSIFYILDKYVLQNCQLSGFYFITYISISVTISVIGHVLVRIC
jgi:hypothetical protein